MNWFTQWSIESGYLKERSMLPNNEGDLHYNQLAESSWLEEQRLQMEIDELQKENTLLKSEVRSFKLLVREYFQAKSKLEYSAVMSKPDALKEVKELSKRILSELEKFTAKDVEELPFKEKEI